MACAVHVPCGSWHVQFMSQLTRLFPHTLGVQPAGCEEQLKTAIWRKEAKRKQQGGSGKPRERAILPHNTSQEKGPSCPTTQCHVGNIGLMSHNKGRRPVAQDVAQQGPNIHSICHEWVPLNKWPCSIEDSMTGLLPFMNGLLQHDWSSSPLEQMAFVSFELQPIHRLLLLPPIQLR